MLDAIIEFFFELFFTPIIEGIVGFVGRIIDRIFPERKMPKWLFWTIKLTLAFLLIAAIGSVFIGLFAWFGAEDTTDKIIGKRLLIFGFITIAIFVVIRIFTPNEEDESSNGVE